MAVLRASGLALILLAAAFLGHFLNGGHDSQRLVQIGFLGLGCIFMIARDNLPCVRFVGGRTVVLLLTVLFTLGIASSLLSLSPSNALREVLLLALLLMVALSVAQEFSQDHDALLSIALYVLGACAALYLFKVAAIWVAAIVTRIPTDSYAFAPGFSNYRFLNHAQTVSLPLLVLAACRCRPSQRMLWLILATGWASLLLALGARGSTLALAAGCSAALVIQRANAFRFCKTMAGVALAGLLLYFILFVWIPAFLGLPPLGALVHVIDRSAGPVSSSYRDILWMRAVEYIAAHPWLGIGPAHYGSYAADLNITAHPHNWALQIGAEWGIPALLCLLALLWVAVRALLQAGRRLDPQDKPGQLVYSALIVTGVAIVVDGLVSGLIVMPVSQLMIVLYLGCAMGWVRSRSGAPPANVRTTAARLGVGAAMLSAFIALLLSAAHDFPRRAAGLAASEEVRFHPARTFPQPRFWLEEPLTEEQLRVILRCGPGRAPPCP